MAITILATRWNYADPADTHGIPETFTIDQSKHSLDVARFMAAIVDALRTGEVYNLGGGKAKSTSILEPRRKRSSI